MKKFLLFSFIIATLIISGCGSSNKSASKNYTYENLDDGHLTSRTYDAYEDKLKAKATGAAMSGLDFSKDDSTETKKNTLSNAYYKAFLSHNSN